MTVITLDSSALNELHSAETKNIFDTVDKLSALGVGKIVDPPQIIVVGDQSSGKSSVLEAISHVYFPARAEGCTRFATELVLRPGSRRRVTASIHFAGSTRPDHFQVADFTQDEIDRIITEARVEMELPDTGRSFSKHVLRLEIEGDDMYPLTLVDLPGCSDGATAAQRADDEAIIKELVERYMENPNSVVLVVIPANEGVVSKAVIEEVLKHDPTKTRTLRVLTKPDLLEPASSVETGWLQVLRGRNTLHNPGVGWHVVRNRADHEKDLGPRDAVEEQFLKLDAWASVPKTNRGIVALRARLSQMLHDQVKQSLPSVLDDIHNMLSVRKLELGRLGQPRTTPEDMKGYLIDIAGDYQKLVSQGIRGHYNDPFFGGFNGTDRKLRSQLRNFHRAIRHTLIVHGPAQEVIDRPHGSTCPPPVPASLEQFIETYTRGIRRPEPVFWAKLCEQIEHQATANQGTELPRYSNIDTAMHLFRKQVEPWQDLAELHLKKVTEEVKVFVDEAFGHIVGPFDSNSTTKAILSTFVDNFFDEREQVLSHKLEELLRPFKEGYAMQHDGDFRSAMEKIAEQRATAGGEGQDRHMQVSVPVPASNDDAGPEYIVDTTQALYDMALQTFTDNLTNLAIESCLIQELPGIFTARLVNDMDNDKLAELAAETEETREHRALLREEIKQLTQGLEQCRRYKPRAAAKFPPSTRPGSKRQQKQTSEHVGSETTSPSLTSKATPSDDGEGFEKGIALRPSDQHGSGKATNGLKAIEQVSGLCDPTGEQPVKANPSRKPVVRLPQVGGSNGPAAATGGSETNEQASVPRDPAGEQPVDSTVSKPAAGSTQAGGLFSATATTSPAPGGQTAQPRRLFGPAAPSSTLADNATKPGNTFSKGFAGFGGGAFPSGGLFGEHPPTSPSPPGQPPAGGLFNFANKPPPPNLFGGPLNTAQNKDAFGQ
ncbi:interferon-induced GTP-binding protein Mx [Colletotrichum tabaci]|uniref:Interferon-induced GTP-binding protein Mx n=1 Tax=Colletotrichum tabaci TaxID=1209068 RepID=A0AAV9SW74_9PEZI